MPHIDAGLLESRLIILEDGLELAQIKTEIRLMLECFECFKYKFTDSGTFSTLISVLQQSDPSLYHCRSSLLSLYSITGHFKVSLLTCFELVHRASFVVDFFCSLGEFKKKYELLLAKQQGYKYGMEKLAIVLAVYRLLEPFVKQKGIFLLLLICSCVNFVIRKSGWHNKRFCSVGKPQVQ